ncbi:hypothetical protein [Kingella negevensis]|uniref:hypothetical protein n=1 Tax=Kingella negevensis TaxID=1522312 RepID=UPI00050A1B8D|nr:hypothetical protein [Kingella negevensis]MDK4689212.1 hypothetical protein [Kingella negevensis]
MASKRERRIIVFICEKSSKKGQRLALSLVFFRLFVGCALHTKIFRQPERLISFENGAWGAPYERITVY